MTMMVAMNQKKWDSLPEDVKKVIDETTGLVMSEEAGRVYDNVRPIMKDLCLKKGMEAIELPDSEKEKLKALSLPLREEWVKEMEAKGLPGREVLDAAIGFLNE